MFLNKIKLVLMEFRIKTRYKIYSIFHSIIVHTHLSKLWNEFEKIPYVFYIDKKNILKL